MISAGGVAAARSENHRGGGGASPTPALQDIRVTAIPHRISKALLEREHYLHSLPGGTIFSFGVFVGSRMLGTLTVGVGPKHGYRMVEGVPAGEAATLTRLWLHDELPPNSESRVIGVVVRALRKHTSLKFVVSYADPAEGHLGTIYQATGWLYTGTSQAMPLVDIGDGVARHSRSVAHAFGTHSLEHFKRNGVPIKLVPQMPKHRYIYLLDKSLIEKLTVPILPYPKKGAIDGNS